MSRPTDWSALGLGSDPTPGDPIVVRQGGQDYSGVADAISRAAATLRRLDAGTSNAESVTALLETKDTVIDDVGKAEGRYRAAGSALKNYAVVLDRVQSETLRALQLARAAENEAAAAQSLQDRYDRMADDVDDDDSGASEQRDEYSRKSAKYAKAANSARAEVSAQARVVEQSIADRDAAAQTAADEIESTTSSDGLKDSWWDDWGSKITKWIAQIAEAISTIAGILALLVCWIPVIGQALAGVLLIVAAVAGIIAALANIALAATGEISWGEAALSIVFAALGCVGLGSLRGAFSALKFAAKGWRLAGGLRGLGGVRGLLAGAGRNFMSSMRNLVRFAKVKARPSTLPRYGDRRISNSLYKSLRGKTPTSQARNAINARHTFPCPDPVLPGRQITAPLSPDHIVSMDKIARMDNFGKLTRAQQESILNLPENLIGLSRSANSSKRELSFAEWTMYKGGKTGQPVIVEPLFRTQMTHMENALAGRIQYLIDSLAKLNVAS